MTGTAPGQRCTTSTVMRCYVSIWRALLRRPYLEHLPTSTNNSILFKSIILTAATNQPASSPNTSTSCKATGTTLCASATACPWIADICTRRPIGNSSRQVSRTRTCARRFGRATRSGSMRLRPVCPFSPYFPPSQLDTSISAANKCPAEYRSPGNRSP